MSASAAMFESQYGESGYSGSDENVAEEIGGEEAGGGSPMESAESDAQEHQVMSNDQSRSRANEGAADGQDSESSAETDETSFETDTEWSADDRGPTEAAGEEALLDAYFAEAAVEEDAQEFLPILGALVPVFKAALPILVNTLAQKGSTALTARLRRLQQQKKPRLLRRETGGGLVEADESDTEALVDALSAMEVVIGPDDRKRVTPTNVLPWRRICHLSIRAANGSMFLGTGFFIGPRTVATAGHCVFLRDNGGWASEIRVSPARDGSATPYGTVTATSLRSVRGWVVGRKRAYDYGAIILPRTFRQPSIGAFGFAAYPDAMLRQGKLNTAGYPGDKPSGTMWYHGRVAKSVAARVITYDTDTAGGQSGSPVWQRRGNTRTVVGIHTNGSPSGNSATRITQPVFTNFMAWRAEGGTEGAVANAPTQYRTSQRGMGSYGANTQNGSSYATA